MKKISAEIVADSINERGNRITTYVLTYPRFIHSEFLTHRMFSRNAASSRAIPFKKMVQMIEEEPFIPIAWQENHSGMQGNKYLNPDSVAYQAAINAWNRAKDAAIIEAKELNDSRMANVTKQLCNRLLEPFMWYTNLVTATEFDNFFELRCPKYKIQGKDSNNVQYFKSKKDALEWVNDVESKYWNYTDLDWIKISESGAEIHIQALAEAMWDARNESKPQELKAGEYHIPFGDRMEGMIIEVDDGTFNWKLKYSSKMDGDSYKIPIAVARCARLSYNTQDGEIDYKKDLELYERLFKSRHWSPFEHVARAMSEDEYSRYVKGRKSVYYAQGMPEEVLHDSKEIQGWANNFRGFIPYRLMVEKF